jgi:5-methyltetrahydropteroyltriglutamate--homocysteine methyltransferase
MQTSVDRILTTHAGSLPRPSALTALHLARSRGEPFDAAALEAEVERATREVVARQIEVGLDVINNGEMGRESFFTYVQHRMSGFGGQSSRAIMADLVRYPGFLERMVRESGAGESVTLMNAPRAQQEVRYSDAGPIRAECEQLRRVLEPHAGAYSEAFVSAPSPGIIAAAMQNAHYPTLEDYVRALADALTTEYRTIVEAGFVLQIDAPDLAMERHALFQDKPLQEFRDFLRVVVDATNAALAGIDPARVRLHVCWGNYEGPHDLDVPLADIWDEVARVRAGGFLLSLANPRHAHEYRHFERAELPPGCVIVPGVIDTTTNYVEHPEAVADRIERVVAVVGEPARVLAGTDCGFETSAGFASVAPDVAWQKFRSLCDGAAIASARLYGGRSAGRE